MRKVLKVRSQRILERWLCVLFMMRANWRGTKPSVLILDEATSNLDSENERRIQEVIDAFHGGISIVFITHRLSTIRNAYVIHVIENGRIIESGDWDLLTARETGRFRRLCEAQDALQEADGVPTFLGGLGGSSPTRGRDPEFTPNL